MTSDTEGRPEEITLLGLIAAIAEALKWFLIIPIGTALAVYLLLGQRAVDYRSTAILRIDETAILLSSPGILRATIEELDMRGELGSTMDDATKALSRRISTTTITPGITQVSLVDRSAERAQQTLTTIIKNFGIQIAPRGQQREEIERQIAANSATIEQMRKYAQTLVGGGRGPRTETSSSNDSALGYVALINEIQAMEDSGGRLIRSLHGLTEADILQEPTLSDAVEPISRLVFSLFAAVAAGLGVLFVVLIGEVVRRAPKDPLALSDLRRIRNALPFSSGHDL